MKIVFVQPKTVFGNTWEALNIGYLASYLEANNYKDLKFYSGFFDSDEKIIKEAQNADVIAFSATSPQMKHALALAKRIKRNTNYIVLGGVHPSALPEETLKNNFVDAVVVGEGEKAFLSIIDGNKDKIVRKPYIQDLDSLPFPNRKLIEQGRNIQIAYHDNGFRIASIFTSRGCPFHCTFCASHTVWERHCRFRSGENILEEFKKTVKDWNIDFIKFSDDTFGLNQEIVIKFCKEKIKVKEKTHWGCNMRVDCTNDDLLKLMYQAGCRELWMGVESGSPGILKDMKKGIKLERVKWAFKRSKELGFKRRAYFLLGMPNESLEDLKMTETLADEIQPDFIGFTILAPYPGTSFYNSGLHKNIDWSTVDEYGNKITQTKYLTNEDLHREQTRLVKKYQQNIVYRQKKR